MNEKNKRFHILFSEEEFLLVKKEAEKHNLSIGEFIRMSVHNEITSKTSYDKILAVKELASFFR